MSQPAHHIHYGRRFRVVAQFQHDADGVEAANEFMTENEHAGVLVVEGGQIILADVNDRGEPVTKQENP